MLPLNVCPIGWQSTAYILREQPFGYCCKSAWITHFQNVDKL